MGIWVGCNSALTLKVVEGEEPGSGRGQIGIRRVVRWGERRRKIFSTPEDKDALVELRAKDGREALRGEIGRSRLLVGDR